MGCWSLVKSLNSRGVGYLRYCQSYVVLVFWVQSSTLQGVGRGYNCQLRRVLVEREREREVSKRKEKGKSRTQNL